MIGFGQLASLNRRFVGAPIGRCRFFPGTHPREDMRWHMQRMWRVRRDAGVKARGREAPGRERGRVVTMYQIMRDPRVIGIFGKLFLQDRGGPGVSREALVGLRLRACNIERAEYLSFIIVWVAGRERFVSL
jgi:hypothetical protein